MGKFFRQCKLEWCEMQTVSWIPEKVAKVGQMVRVKNRKADDWQLWTVMSVGPRQDSDTVRALEQQHKWTRPHSDI